MAEEKKTGEKKHITGARIAKEIRQYKKTRCFRRCIRRCASCLKF
ncbi:MAG: hypothetical protein ACLR07_13630 [Christensenellales bacterium]